MDWFRHYHGLCTDPKLHRASRVAGVRRSVIIASWCAVLEIASQSDPRGSAPDLDADSLAFMVDEKPATAARVLDAFRQLGMLGEGNSVAAWSKRQRSSDESAERVRRHRAAKRLNGHDPEPGGNVSETGRNEQNRTEQIREDTEREDSPPTASESPPPHTHAREEAAADAVAGLIARVEPLGANPAQVRRMVQAWDACIPPPHVRRLIEEALFDPEVRNPVKWVGRMVGVVAAELAHERQVETKPEGETVLQAANRMFAERAAKRAEEDARVLN